MTGSSPELRSFLEAEMFYGVKKRERIAYAVAGGGLAIGLMGMIAVVTMLPLKQTEAFLAIVDKDTGVAERVVAVEKAGMEQAEAIEEPEVDLAALRPPITIAVSKMSKFSNNLAGLEL